mmetsp:Transcript_28446/g.79530  ORF Transcript_28446/g.79530 Transcript_28446/m.79530 type:complete len:268 (+) Transcript_28446:2371-3174(+)
MSVNRTALLRPPCEADTCAGASLSGNGWGLKRATMHGEAEVACWFFTVNSPDASRKARQSHEGMDIKGRTVAPPPGTARAWPLSEPFDGCRKTLAARSSWSTWHTFSAKGHGVVPVGNSPSFRVLCLAHDSHITWPRRLRSFRIMSVGAPSPAMCPRMSASRNSKMRWRAARWPSSMSPAEPWVRSAAPASLDFSTAFASSFSSCAESIFCCRISMNWGSATVPRSRSRRPRAPTSPVSPQPRPPCPGPGSPEATQCKSLVPTTSII